MSPFARWCRFNFVGAIGMGVQLGSLALLNQGMPGHYLVVTALALEITLLHNFAWHVGYTWRDRSDPQGLKPASFGSGLAARLKSCPVTERFCVVRPLKSRAYAIRNAAVVQQLLRFHLTNGLVSYLGNLVLMRLLVESVHMPVLAANSIAILCCSILNFLLADRWAFVASSPIPDAPARPDLVTLSATLPPAPD